MRIALGIEYEGTTYHGWQRQQPKLATIQAAVEDALSKVAAHPIRIYCAGRTDVGVHAKEQVVHFDTSAEREFRAWVLGGNSNLPPTISILWATEVTADFHARFSAVARSYRYLIYNSPVRPAILSNLVTWHCQPLVEKLMQKAGQYLVGKHDFSSFRGCDCQATTPWRRIEKISVQRRGKLIIVDVKANAFLMHMVRNIVGVLIAIGEGKREPIWAEEVLKQCDRTVAGITASPTGLYLMKVYYE